MFERLVADRYSRYLESEGLLPPCQFAYRKGLGICDALLTVSHLLQDALDKGSESRLMQLYFNAAFDRVNRRGLLHKLSAVGLGGSILVVLEQFLKDRT